MTCVEFRDGDIADYYHIEMEGPSRIRVLDISSTGTTTVDAIVLD
jgi:hypothetical protein